MRKVFYKDTTAAAATSFEEHRIYVKRLPDRARAEQIRDYFAPYGHIIQIELKNGFSFISYDTEDAVEQAIRNTHDQKFLGSKLHVERAKSLETTRREKSAANDACYTCGNLGHWAKHCPERSR